MKNAVKGCLALLIVCSLGFSSPTLADEPQPQSLCGSVTGGAVNYFAWECWNDSIFQVVNTESLDSNGWQYTFDGGTVDFAGPAGFEICGLGFRETNDELWFTVNAGLDLLTGYPMQGALNGSVSYGDLFINLSGLDFATAHSLGRLFAVHFAAGNDAGVTQTGVYSNVAAKSVVDQNDGPHNRQGYENYIYNIQHGVPGYGDLPVNQTYFGLDLGLNVIDSGTYLGAISFVDSSELSASGYNTTLFSCPVTVAFKFQKQLIIDQCGVIGGDGTSCLDCANIPCGQSTVDICGICNGDGTSCLDCNNVPNGGAEYDVCGVCDGDGTSCLDCNNVPNGGAQFDICGVCGGDGTSCLDCNNIPNGGAQLDICGVCGGDGTSCLDCAGVPYGTSQLDRCGVCNGDGFSCCECTETDISASLEEMRRKLMKLFKLNKKTFKRLSRPDVKKFINRLGKQNKALYEQAAALIATIPSIARVCASTDFCRDVVSNQNIKVQYRKLVKRMARLTRKIPRPQGGTCLRSSNCGKLSGSDEIRRVQRESGQSASGVPDRTSICS